MKKIYSILLIASTLFFFACQQEEKLAGEETGYLRLSINEDVSTNARADVPANYDAEKIGVQILNAEGKVQESLEPWEIGTAKQVELPVGTYTLKASSAGWDGQAAGFEIPYYTGSEEVTITAGAKLNKTITCTLANVKVSTVLYPELLEKVSNVTVKVYDDSETYSVLFSKTTQDAAYFPVVDALYADITIVSDKGTNTLEKQQLCNAEGTINARDHYILNIKPQDSGNSQISVEVDPTTHEYTYTFSMSTKPTESVTLSAAPWDRLAYLQATDIVTGTGVSMEGIKFQYREKTTTAAQAESEEEKTWNDVVTTSEEGKYTAMLTGLTASTEYEYRLVNGENTAIGKEQSFTTGAADAQTALVNGGFEDWFLLEANLGFMGGASSTWYPCSETYYTDNGGSFWDSSNPGTTQGMGSLSGGLNPTQGNTDVVHTGSKSAKLETQWAVMKLAAASLYTGKFYDLVGTDGAKIDFGQSFTSRPIFLKGWYQYKSEVIDNENQEVGKSGVLEKGDSDLCAIYIILSKGVHQVDNTNTNTLLTMDNVWNDDNFIAYGELSAEQCVDTEGQWKDFTIPLQYKENQFGEQPTHLIIVCTSSKYGDYFTGAVGSTLYVDDFSLVYEGTPSVWKNK